MISVLLGLILLCVIVGVVFWAAQTLLVLIPLSEPFRTIIRVLFVLVAVIVVIWVFVTLLEMIGVNVPLMHLGNVR